MVYEPDLSANPTTDEIQGEISFLNAMKHSLDPASPSSAPDIAYYDRTIEELIQLLQQYIPRHDGVAESRNGEAGPAYPSFPESPAGESSESSAFSRKRSLASMGDFDVTDPKRLSLNGSPALSPGTPGTPDSLTEHYSSGPNLGVPPNASHNSHGMYGYSQSRDASGGFGGPQGYQAATVPQFAFQAPQDASMPIRPNQAGGGIFQQQQVQFGVPQFLTPQFSGAGPSNVRRSNLGDYGNYIDLTNDDYQGQSNASIEPYPELDNAYRGDDDQRPAPVNAFNQDFMNEEQLAQFLITPTPQGGAYAFGGGAQMADMLNNNHVAAPIPRIINADFQQNRGQQNNNGLEQELFGDDFDMPQMDSGANPEALTKLIENIKPHDEIPPEGRQQTPQAMSCKLMEHQKLGLTWLMKMEEGSAKGGILADEMGLGKTIQALALILARPSNDPACKTTLIIAPVALMKQWEKELQRHVKASHQLKVFIYHGHGKSADFAKLRKFDVVLTTFGTLGSEMKQMERRREAELVLREEREPEFVRKGKDRLALIGAECMWYRVIIDEAQMIKNKSTQVSRASNEIMAHHRLCMSGTPMMNSVDELYPLIRFLRIKPYNDSARFQWDIAKPFKNSKSDWKQKQVIGRLQALLKSIMLRREKTSVVDGIQICQIPPKVVELQNVEFNDEERALYKAIETNSQLTFNRYLQKGTVNNNYANVLVLLLRLRQACCHPHLIKDLGVQVSTEGIAEDDLLTRAKEINPDVVVRLKNADGFECPICLEVDLNPTIIIPCGHTCCGECFQKLIDPTIAIREGNDEATAPRCPHCRGTLSSKKITDYKHFCKVFCPERLDESDRPKEEENKEEDEEEEDSDSDSDDEDKDGINDEGDLDGFVVPDDADDDYKAPSPINGPEDTLEEAATKAKSKKGKSKAQAGPKKPKMTLAQLKKESLRNKASKKKYLRRLRKTYVPSGKIEKTIELLRDIQSNDPTEKTLIFSQFTSLLDLVEVPLMDTGIKYQRYDGSMKMEERAEAVNQFMDDASQKVMLISLKAGNAGLNLSKASHVIMLDPFWNPFIEDQAVDRAHRMPQEREVHVHRVLVPETVEDRICALQDKKRELINAALDEKAGKSLSRLSVQNLMFLFGLTRQRD